MSVYKTGMPEDITFNEYDSAFFAGVGLMASQQPPIPGHEDHVTRIQVEVDGHVLAAHLGPKDARALGEWLGDSTRRDLEGSLERSQYEVQALENALGVFADQVEHVVGKEQLSLEGRTLLSITGAGLRALGTRQAPSSGV